MTSVSDENWNRTLEEFMVNAPLIIISGGIANVTRLVVSSSARAVIGTARLAQISNRAGRSSA